MTEPTTEQVAEAIVNAHFASKAESFTAEYLDLAAAVQALYAPVLAEKDAEIEQVRRGARTLGETIHKQCLMVLDATGLHHMVGEDGDGDWGAIWENLLEMRPELERLRAQVRRVEAHCTEVEQSQPPSIGFGGVRFPALTNTDLVRAALAGPGGKGEQ